MSAASRTAFALLQTVGHPLGRSAFMKGCGCWARRQGRTPGPASAGCKPFRRRCEIKPACLLDRKTMAGLSLPARDPHNFSRYILRRKNKIDTSAGDRARGHVGLACGVEFLGDG